jgi:hypothetical protein
MCGSNIGSTESTASFLCMHKHTSTHFNCKEAHVFDMGLQHYLLIKLEHLGEGGDLYMKVSAKYVSTDYGFGIDITILDKYSNTICSVVFCIKGVICDNNGIKRRTF